MRIVRSAGALTLALCLAAPAAAQGIIPSVIGATIGNMVAQNSAYARCLSGEAPKAKKISLALGRTQAAMSAYMRLAGAAPAADASAAFTHKQKLWSWSMGGQAGEVGAIDDPVARAHIARGSALPAPTSFVLSGDQRSAAGIWIVPGQSEGDAPLGHYRVSFRPEGRSLPQGGQAWKVTSIEVIAGSAEAAPVAQYCSKPGDVEEHRIAVEKYKEERARKKAEKAARRAAAGNS